MLLTKAQGFFEKMDRDMDKGWQISRQWVDNPGPADRCRIAADKLHGAMHAEDEKLGILMAAYILKHAPGIDSVDIDMEGEIQNTILIMSPDFPPPQETLFEGGMSSDDATSQAHEEFSKLYKAGRKFRYSTKDLATEQWTEVAVAGDEAEAETIRQKAIENRIRALSTGR
jgi:hypothetical protein